MNNHPGIGIFGGRLPNNTEQYPIVNNSLLVSANDGLLLDCVSNSSQSGVGVLNGPHNLIFPTGNTMVLNPFNRPGVLRLQTSYLSSLAAAEC